MSRLCEKYERFWCDRKSNDLNFSINMRLKSFKMRYNFCIWHSWCFWTEIRKDENEKVSEQLTDNFFTNFDVILSFAIEKCELLNETNREDIFAENIWFRDVAKRLNKANCEVNEADEQKTADFWITLYVDSSAKTRKSKLLTDFRAWCWRICSWNLLWKLKFCLQRLQIAQTQTIREFDFCEKDEHENVDFFFDSHTDLSVKFVKDEFLNEMIDFENVNDSHICFNCIVNETKDDELIVDIFTKSHVALIVLMRFRVSCSLMCSKNFLLKLKFCLQDLHIARTHATSWIDAFFILFDIVTNVFNERFKRDAFNLVDKQVMRNRHSTFCFEISCLQCEHVVVFFVDFDLVSNVKDERCESLNETNREDIFVENIWLRDVANEVLETCETNEHAIVDFFSDSHVNLNVKFVKDEFLNDVIDSKNCIDVFFIDFDTVSNVNDEKIERFNKMIDLNVVANSNIEFWDFANDICVIDDFFLISHTKLIALFERWEFLTNFRVSWSRICSYNVSLKLKFCLQILQIIWTTCWFDAFFIDFDITFSVFNWKFELLDETRRENASENVFARVLLKRFNEMNSNWILNHSDARSHKHFDNKFSKSDLRYRCWCCVINNDWFL